MRPVRLTGENFRSWAAFDVAFEDGCTAIVGANGAGKSSLLQAVETALFGAPGGRMEALVRRGEPEMYVDLDFEHAGARYSVLRGWRAAGGGKSYCKLNRHEKNGDMTSLTAESIKATEQRIRDVLGVDRTTWRSSAYLAQGDGDAFTNAGAAERKRILGSVLGLHLWDELAMLAKADRVAKQKVADGLGLRIGQLREVAVQRPEYERQVEAFRGLVGECGGRVAELAKSVDREAEARAAQEAARERRRVLVERLNEARGRVQAASGEGVPLIRQLNEIADATQHLERLRLEARTAASRRRALGEARERAEQGKAAEAAMKAWLRDAERLQADLKRAGDVVGVAGHVAWEAAEALEQFDAQDVPTCQTCGQVVEAGARAKARAALVAEQKKRDGEAESAVAAEAGFAKQLQEHEAQKPEVVRYDPAEVPLLEQGVEGAERAAQMVVQAEARLEAKPGLEEALEAVRGRLAEAQEVEQSAQEAVQAWEEPPPVADSREQLEQMRAELTRLQNLQARAERDFEQLEKAEAEIADFEAKLQVVADEAALFGLLEKAYGRDGVPSMLIESAAIPQMERDASRIATELGGDYRIELRSTRALKSGGEAETLDCVAVTATGEAPIETLSGGERTRFDLALRIALARLLADRRGADVRMLAVDEPEFLDDAGMERLAGVVRGLVSDFDSAVLISHQPALREAFDVTWSVARDAEGVSVLA